MKRKIDMITEMLEKLEKKMNQNIFEGKYQECIDVLSQLQDKPLLADFVTKYEGKIYDHVGPKVALICMDCSEEYINAYLQKLEYCNLELVIWNSLKDSLQDIIEYARKSECEYITFLEPDMKVQADKIVREVMMMDKMPMGDMAICAHNHIEHCSNQVIAHYTTFYHGVNANDIYDGKDILKTILENGENLLGNITCAMIRREQLLKLENDKINALSSGNSRMQRLFFYFQLIEKSKLFFLLEEKVSVLCEERDEDYANQQEYSMLLSKIGYQESQPLFLQQQEIAQLEKEITFIYTDKGEYYNLLPIAKEAEKRGYHIEFTRDIYQKCNIGVYCQHGYYPENSKFSMVLMHDVSQGQLRWPNIWQIENWNRFDLGVLMGPQWVERWQKCACSGWPLTKRGVYAFGYPKSDYVQSAEIKDRAQDLREKYHMKYEQSVLYAPSWENNGKEDDFIQACKDLRVNLLVKQADWSVEYQEIIDNINEQRSLHEGSYNHLYYIEPEENIMVALELCDLIVSDESSVMGEGLIFNKPSIAVSDWLIPDCNPMRYASAKFDYVHHCKKDELKEKVQDVLRNYDEYRKNLEEKRDGIFGNVGSVCTSIMDAVDYYTGNGTNMDFKKLQVNSKYNMIKMWN